MVEFEQYVMFFVASELTCASLSTYGSDYWEALFPSVT